jgi:hypothetical protein
LPPLVYNWVAKEKIGTLLLASEMPVPIPRSCTVASVGTPVPFFKVGIVFYNWHTIRGGLVSGFFQVGIVSYKLVYNHKLEEDEEEEVFIHNLNC